MKRGYPGVILVVLVLSVLLIPWLHAADDAGTRPKIGVVLSGGGARGAAHIGVLRMLEEYHIPIDYLAGTSMGSVIGGLYASGVSLEELERMTHAVDWIEVFTDISSRREMLYRDKPGPENYLLTYTIESREDLRLPRGLIRGRRLDLLLRSFTLGASGDFNAFPIPFRSVAADIVTGEMVALDRGDLAEAIRASMAIPGVFPPIEIQGKLLVDGGVARNLPVDVVRLMGADVVIAVNIGTPLRKRDELEDFLGIVDQTTNFLTNNNVDIQVGSLKEQDILLVPDLGDITTASFERMGDAVDIGAEAAKSASEDLKRYSLSESQYHSFRQQQIEKSRHSEFIDFVEIDQKALFGTRYLENRIRSRIGRRTDADLLAYDIFQLSEREDLEDVDMLPVERNGKKGVLLRPRKNMRLQHRIRLGFELANDFEGDNSHQLLVDYRLRNINRLGAQWKNEIVFGEVRGIHSEFYQPFDPYTWKAFMAPYAAYRASPVDRYDASERTARYDVHKRHCGMDFGLQMAEYGEVRLGVMRGKYLSDVKTGAPALPEYHTDDGAYTVQLVIDRYDNPNFPKKGILFMGRYLDGRKNLGSDDSYKQLDISLAKPVTLERHTAILKCRWSSTTGISDPFLQGFFLGGLFNLSGLRPGQLYGQDMAFAELIYYYQVLSLPSALGRNLYIGASCEAGNILTDENRIHRKDLIYAGSIFVSAESIIGPIHLGAGHSDQGDNAVYLYVGKCY